MMKKYFFLLFIGLVFGSSGMAQTAGNPAEVEPAVPVMRHKYFIDYIMGPYLFVHEIGYDAAMMQGARLGFNLKPSLQFSIEYVVGQQEDVAGTMGMTHNANLQFSYLLNPDGIHFSPYFFGGGGFFELKDFTSDVYGISWHLGFGSTVKVTNRVQGILEARYLNTGLLDLGGQNQLAVFWGARLGF